MKLHIYLIASYGNHPQLFIGATQQAAALKVIEGNCRPQEELTALQELLDQGPGNIVLTRWWQNNYDYAIYTIYELSEGEQ